jgi:hypothetical protein
MSWADVDAVIERELLGLPGWCTIEKAKRMAELARGAHLCVELGVFGSRGLCAMAITLKDQGFGRADGVDPYTPAAALEGVNDPKNDLWWSNLDYEAIARAAQEGIYRLGLIAYAHLIRMRSFDVVGYYNDETVDCIHLDANHAESTSCEDVALWAPKIKPGGIWVFDDTNWESTKKAQRELEAIGFEVIEDHVQWKVYRKP